MSAGLKRYFTGQPCARGHVSERLVSNLGCLVCGAAKRKRQRQANPEKEAATKRAWCAKNREKVRAIKNAWNAKPEAKADQKLRSRKYHEANRDKTNAAHYGWAERNPGKVTALAAKRRADRLQRTPAWADFEAIDAVYYQARAMREQGFFATVDHVIPLRGETVSGLHVASNLQIIHDLDNKRKSNRFLME